MAATVLRMKGCSVALKASRSQRYWPKYRFSLATTASAEAKFGYILSQPRGKVQPWKTHCRPKSLASTRMSS